MAGCTRKGGMKYNGGRKRTTTRRRHGHRPRKTVRHGRKGGKRSGHKKRSRRGRKHGGSLKTTLRQQMADHYGSANPKENWAAATLTGQSGTSRNITHLGHEIWRGLSHLNPGSWHW